MALLVQLHANLPDIFKDHERRLYVFICRNQACRRKEGSVRALRAIKVLLESEAQEAANPSNVPSEPSLLPHKLGQEIFGRGRASDPAERGNPFSFSADAVGQEHRGSKPCSHDSRWSSASQECSDLDEENRMSMSFAEKVKVSVKVEVEPAPLLVPWPLRSQLPRPFPTYYLDADYETLERTSTAPPHARSMVGLDEESTREVSASDSSAAFESTVDETFQRFADRLAQNPLQVLRYEFGGLPLLYSDTDGVGAMVSRSLRATRTKTTNPSGHKFYPDFPTCGRCKSPRVFEFQMTPQAITEVETEQPGLDGMEWGTLIVAVCGSDCHAAVPDGTTFYTEEWIGVQWEERKC